MVAVFSTRLTYVFGRPRNLSLMSMSARVAAVAAVIGFYCDN